MQHLFVDGRQEWRVTLVEQRSFIEADSVVSTWHLLNSINAIKRPLRLRSNADKDIRCEPFDCIMGLSSPPFAWNLRLFGTSHKRTQRLAKGERCHPRRLYQGRGHERGSRRSSPAAIVFSTNDKSRDWGPHHLCHEEVSCASYPHPPEADSPRRKSSAC